MTTLDFIFSSERKRVCESESNTNQHTRNNEVSTVGIYNPASEERDVVFVIQVFVCTYSTVATVTTGFLPP